MRSRGGSVTPRARVQKVAPRQFDEYVLADADGDATPDQRAVLEADPAAWRVSLQARLREAEENLKSSRSLTGDERAQVMADLDLEVQRLKSALARQNREPAGAANQRRAGAARRRSCTANAARRANAAAGVLGTRTCRGMGGWPTRAGRRQSRGPRDAHRERRTSIGLEPPPAGSVVGWSQR